MSVVGAYNYYGRGGRSEIGVARRRRCSNYSQMRTSYYRNGTSNSQSSGMNSERSSSTSQRIAALNLISETHAFLDPNTYFSHLRTLYRGTLPAVYKGHIGNALGVAYYYGYGTQHSLTAACTHFELAQSWGVLEGKSNLTRVWQNAMEGPIGRSVQLNPSLIDGGVERLKTTSSRGGDSEDSVTSTADIDGPDCKDNGVERGYLYGCNTHDYSTRTSFSWSDEAIPFYEERNNVLRYEECNKREKTINVNDYDEHQKHYKNTRAVRYRPECTKCREDDDKLRIIHGRELFNAGMELFGCGCTESEWLPLFVSSFEKDWFTDREDRGKNLSKKFETHLENRIMRIPSDQTRLEEMDVKALFVYFYYYLLASGKNTFDTMPSSCLALLSEAIDSRVNYSIALWQLLLLRGLLKAKILGYLRGALADLSFALECCDDLNRMTDLRIASLFVIKQVMCQSSIPYNRNCDLSYAEGDRACKTRRRESQKFNLDKSDVHKFDLGKNDSSTCNLYYSHPTAEYLPEQLFQLLCSKFDSLISELLSMPLTIQEPNVINRLRSQRITIAFPMVFHVLGPSASYINQFNFPRQAFRDLNRMVEIASVLQRS